MIKAAVVGAGALGLLSAYQLALAGCQVCVLERCRVGRESSWAGGGIVSPLYPWRYSATVTALAHWSQDFYPGSGSVCWRKRVSIPKCMSPGCTG